MGFLKKKIPMPESSRFDRLDDQTLFLLVEQAISTAISSFQQAQGGGADTPTHLHNCDTALSDAQAGVRSILRRRLAIERGL